MNQLKQQELQSIKFCCKTFKGAVTAYQNPNFKVYKNKIILLTVGDSGSLTQEQKEQLLRRLKTEETQDQKTPKSLDKIKNQMMHHIAIKFCPFCGKEIGNIFF